MIYLKGDLLSVVKSNNIIVHGCNSRGVMGSGVAKAVREKYPDCFKKYVEDLSYGKKRLGEVSWYQVVPSETIFIGNAITQSDYGRDSSLRYVSYDAIDTCFSDIFHVAKKYGMNVNIPKIGAGLGGGDWSIIEKIIIRNAVKKDFLGELICWEL